MSIKIMSWNVEHFKERTDRIDQVHGWVKKHDPDLVGLLEIENDEVVDALQEKMSGYDFSVTAGPQRQEILVAWKRKSFDRVIVKQKREFKAYNPHLRPGSLVNMKKGKKEVNVLFLHTDSGTAASDFGNRLEMFNHIWKLKKKLDKKSEGTASLIALGDLNTMGLFYPKRRVANRLVDGPAEVDALKEFAVKAGMRVLEKGFELTFNNGRLKSDLDHVIASDDLQFASYDKTDGSGRCHVEVDGWPRLKGSQQKSFINTISDHAMLVFEMK